MEHDSMYKVKQSQSECVYMCVCVCVYSFKPDLAT